MELPSIYNSPHEFDNLAQNYLNYLNSLNTNFEGAIFFEKTRFGYKVQLFIPVKVDVTKILGAYGFLKTVCVEGKFNFNPVRGQFCKRPHLLLNWSKK